RMRLFFTERLTFFPNPLKRDSLRFHAWTTYCHISQPPNTKMNKAELTEAVLKNLGKDTTKKAAADTVEAVLTAIAAGIKKDKVVQIIGFGTFKVTARKARQGRNPKTGEKIKIKASKSVRFSPSS